MDRLHASVIHSLLTPNAVAILNGVKVYFQIDSTNRYLLTKARQGLKGRWACLAEYQTAGYGRNGKSWLSPLNSGLCLSLLWTFKLHINQLSGLSLVVGVALAETLESYGISGIGLKWPNDLYWSGRKLAGILIELVISGNEINVIIGIGINIHFTTKNLININQPVIDLVSINHQLISRNQLAAILLSNLSSILQKFEQEGFEPFIESWQQRDILKGQKLQIILPDGKINTGIGVGINKNGYLLLQDQSAVLMITSGEVTVRINY